MINMRALTAAFYAFACYAALNAAEITPIHIPACAMPPKLDGALDDPAWQSAAKIGQLYLANTNAPVSDTTVWLARDRQWLYLGFQCVNSNMAHVAQTVFKHDDIYPNFYANESVEIYLKPEAAKDRYYWFVLSAANVGMEQRLQKTPVSRQEVAWSAPWRRLTKIRPDGWTAEIAIPLYALECDDLSGAQINLVRNFRQVTLDQMGAKQGEQTVMSTLQPGTPDRRYTHDFEKFAAVAGLGGFRPEQPFAPKIAAAEVAGLQECEGSYFYDVNIKLMRFTGIKGTALVEVVENTGDGENVKISRLVHMDGIMPPGYSGPYQLDLTLKTPAGELRERQVKVALVNPDNRSLLAETTIDDMSALQLIKKIFVGRSYYSSEQNAEIVLELGLPEALRKNAALVVAVNRSEISKFQDLTAEMTLQIPTAKLAEGDNNTTVRLISGGKELAVKEMNIRRLPPRPGFEVKADFIRGVLLQDDRPVFPVGMYVAHWSSNFPFTVDAAPGDDEALFKYLAGIGFNTLAHEHICKEPGALEAAAASAGRFAELADKYGMNVVEWNSPMPKWPGYKPGDSRPPLTQPLGERVDYQRQWYKGLEPTLIAVAKVLRERRNLLAYYNVDEPNLNDSDVKIKVAEWYYETVLKIDPCRPQFLLYSMNIPHGDNWTRWGQVLGFDIYPRPFTGRIFSEPGWYTAYYAYKLRERCRQDNKVMFFVPLSNYLDLGRTPISMDKAHMLCQAYTAVIYGARGLLYFVLHVVVGEDAWDALRTINAQIREMSPALLNGDVAQQIRYVPDNFNPAEQKFPMVNAAVFKYPDGDYLLLAANIVAHAVETTFEIGGLQNVDRLFAGDNAAARSDARPPAEKSTLARLLPWRASVPASRISMDGESFSDKIEGYGVRAYRLKLAARPADGAVGLPVPVAVAVSMKAVPEETAPRVDVAGIVRRVRQGKNHIPNPCFRRQFNKGVPDFFLPNWGPGHDPARGQKGSSWWLDDQNPWNGHPSLCMVYTKPELSTGMGGVFYPPLSGAGQPPQLVFSFYAKGAQEGDRVNVTLPFVKGGSKTFALTKDWQRYQVAGALRPAGPHPDFTGNPGYKIWIAPAPPAGTRIWVSGLQMEAGETATEFRDDAADAMR